MNALRPSLTPAWLLLLLLLLLLYLNIQYPVSIS